MKFSKIFILGRKKESGSSTEDIRHGHQRGSTTARKSTMDRGGKRRNNGDSRQTRKNDRFKNGELGGALLLFFEPLLISQLVDSLVPYQSTVESPQRC